MAKATICKKDTATVPGAVLFAFDGVADPVQVQPSDFPQEIVDKLLINGISQKIGDSYAGAENGTEAHSIALALIERLKEGNWGVSRGAGAPRTTQLAEALARVTGQPVEACQEKISSMDEDTVKSLRKNGKVQAAIAEIKLEAAQAKLQAAKEKAAAEGEELSF